MSLRLEQWKTFPEDRGTSTWAMIQKAYPEEGKQLADAIRKDAVRKLEQSIQSALTPLSGTVALDRYWALRIDGKNAEANEVLKQTAAQGVPLPELKK